MYFMYNFYVAQVFGVIGLILSILSMQMKTKKNIMIMLLLLNLASALNFLFLDSITGCLICFFAVFETYINYLYDSKGKKIPIYVIAFYILLNLVLGLISFKSLIDIIPIVCALLYITTVCTKSESKIRKLMFSNQALWLIYDINSKAYMFAITNILTLISIVVAFFRFDYKRD